MRRSANARPATGLIAPAVHLWRTAPASYKRDVLTLAVMTPGMLFVFVLAWGLLPA